jgi:hypothetical protein
MRYATDIQLDQVIIHTLGNSQSDGLELSERIIPMGDKQSLDDNQPMVKYFIRHIEKSLKRVSTAAARFTDMKKDSTSGICKGILDGSMGLVEGSQWMAKKLYDITKGNSRITRGNLAMAFYRAGNKPDVPRYLAILKIDPSDAYIRKVKKDSEGKRYISLEIEGTVMPTLGEDLQKCAFVQPLDPRREYDMLVLDHQSGNETRQIAKFFMGNFLGAEPAYDNQKQTKDFYINAIGAASELRSTLQPRENELLRGAIDIAMNSSHINIDTWTDGLPVPEKAKEQMEKKLSALPNREFDTDATVATKLTRKQIFLGDNNLKVVVSAEGFKETISSVIHIKDDPEKGSYYRVEIHTKKWEEVAQ